MNDRLTRQRFFRSLRSRFCVALLFLFAGTSNALAGQSEEQVNGYTRTTWIRAESEPASVSGMTQTPDGWMWLSDEKDVYRFDGVNFDRITLPITDTSSIVAMTSTSSGDVWLAYGTGKVFVLPHGDYGHPRTINGLDTPIDQLVAGSNGSMWAVSDGKLYRASGKSWERVSARMGLADQRVYATMLDSEGTLWVLEGDGLFSLPEKEAMFEFRKSEYQSLHQSEGARRGLASELGLQTPSRSQAYLISLIVAAGGNVANDHSSHMRMISDPVAGIWMDPDGGIYKMAVKGPDAARALARNLIDATGPIENLKMDMLQDRGFAFLLDRQGNIWVGTASGLARFRPHRVTKLELPSDLANFAMLAAPDRGMAFGTASYAALLRWWHADHQVTSSGDYLGSVFTAYRDRDGDVLIGGDDGRIWKSSGGKFTPFDMQPPSVNGREPITTMARDGQDTLWVQVKLQPLYALRKGTWLLNGGLSGLPRSGVAERLVADSRGRLWLGFDHEVDIVDGTHVSRFGPDQGMTIKNVRDIVPDGIPLAGGDDGMAAFDGRHFHAINAYNKTALLGITGIVRLDDGSVWVNGQDGGVRMDAREIQQAMDDPSYKVSFGVIGNDDGMPGGAQINFPVPSLIRSKDGRLWFANDKGIGVIDPTKAPENQVPPNTVIRAVRADDKACAVGDHIHLAAGTRNIEIDYTALALSDGSKAYFRYRITDVDTQWNDAGSRRQAFYGNLGPGLHRFEVMASNEDGVWNKDPTTMDIVIEPTFQQTGWFKAICVLVAALLLWLIYSYRVRLLTYRLGQRLAERHGERERIARELHDTYLQTVQGLVMKVHAASSGLAEGDGRDRITKALNLADQALTEGRDRVNALRSRSASSGGLVEALEKVTKEFEGEQLPSFEIASTGSPKPIDPLVNDDLHASGREAIVNAFTHARANSIRVSIRHDRQGLTLEISDDGQGIDPKIVADGGVDRHWGLLGMKERMEHIGGRFQLTSSAESGTTIRLFVPRSRAYVDHGLFH